MADIFDTYPVLRDLDPYSDAVQYDFDDCWTVLNPDRGYEEQDVAAALILCRGNLSRAARTLGRKRRSLHNFVLRNVMLKDLMEDITEEMLDEIEDKHYGAALMGDTTVQRFLLTTKGKDRGYVTRTENTGKNGDELIPKPNISAEALGAAGTEALAALLEARDRAVKEGPSGE